jgi:hypothetical protein
MTIVIVVDGVVMGMVGIIMDGDIRLVGIRITRIVSVFGILIAGFG